MVLLRCADLEGEETLVEQDPAILSLPDVIYVPVNYAKSQWGIYDHGGRLVPSCCYFRGPHSGAMGHELMMPLRHGDVVAHAPERLYVYGGFIHGHYGHFILSTLSRYWNVVEDRRDDLRILYHSNEDIAASFQRPFIADLFGAMGLGLDNFVCFDEPTRISRLVVPCPSFEETGFAHRAFARLGRALGDILTGGDVQDRSETPIYMSKARLAHGIGHLVNEEEFSDVLSRHGVEVVHPEELDLARQIALFRSRPLIAALTGSALHTSIFAPGRTMVGLSYGDTLYSSYTMIDRIGDHRSFYFYPHGEIELLPRSAQFHLDYRLTDVRRTAEQFLRLIEMAADLAHERVGYRLPSDKTLNGPSSCPNVARGKPTRQSSFGPREALGGPEGYRSTATSGMLTGRYQFHTDHEDRPWWDVDLSCRHEIAEIRIHNRSDNSQERASRFMILVSDDDAEWRELHRQDVPLTFGNGLDDSAFVWKAEDRIATRFVRIMLLGTSFLHLDQVQVFGRPSPSGQQPAPIAECTRSRPNFQV